MKTVEMALGVWMSFHADLGVDMEALLLPPATEQQIVAVEEQIGYRLPEDLRALYKIANGQIDPYSSEYRNDTELSAKTPWAPLFGNYEFMPLDVALEQYLMYLDMHESEKSFKEKYNAANPEQAIEPQVWEVRDGDIVNESGWNPNWFSFAGGEANSYFVDMSPPRGGVPGQVVLHGADEWVLQVVASSVSDLMDSAAHFLDVNDAARFDYTDAESGSTDDHWNFLYFDMDWRNPQTAQENNSEPSEYTAWLEEQAQITNQQGAQFSLWMSDQGIKADRSGEIVSWVVSNIFHTIYSQIPPPNVVQAMHEFAVQQGQVEEADIVKNSSLDYMEVDIEKQRRNLYLSVLVSVSLDQNRHSLELYPFVDASEAILMYHQFKLEAAQWSQQEMAQANALWQHVLELPLDKNNGLYLMGPVENSNVDTPAVQICQSSFNEETFKSTDKCFVVNFNDFLVE